MRVGALLLGSLSTSLLVCHLAGFAEDLPAPPANQPDTASTPLSTTPPPGTFAERLAKPVSADFQAVDFTSAMNFLAESSGVNILMSERAQKASKPVTVHLVDMPFQRAVDYIVRGQGLLFRFDDQAIWVATKDEMESEPSETKIFPLLQGPGLFATFEPMQGTRDSVALQGKKVQEMTTLKDVVEDVIPTSSKSSIELDERSGSLIMTNVPYYLQQTEALLRQLDVTPIQVLIEARFIELTLTDTTELAIDGELTGNVAITKRTEANKTRSPALQLSSTGNILQRGTKTSFTDFSNQTSGNGLNFTVQGILSGTQYNAVLHALTEHRKSKTLSAPRVTTLNNQTATIKVVTEFVYATQYKPTVIQEDLNGDGDFKDVASNGTRETRFVNVPQGFLTKDLGILLNVTPSVGQDLRTITLALKPEVSEKKTDDVFNGEVSLPRFTSRNLETTVAVDRGQTVVLGGLMKDTTSKTMTKVPVLGSIPVLGALFRKQNDSVERSNLLIFVTADLVNPTGAALAQLAPDAS